VTPQEIVHARRREGDAELRALADDAQVAPPGILTGEAKDESDDVSFKRVVRNVAMSRIGPVPSDKLTVPAHERRRRHEEGRPALTRSSRASVAITA
jgi:hypothetical protein